jgi:hypothetical protein
MPLNHYGIWGGLTPLEKALLTPHTQLTGQTRPGETTADPRQNPSTAVAERSATSYFDLKKSERVEAPGRR